MPRRFAAGQLAGFSAVGVAMLAPGPTRLVQHWSEGTIYPWWMLLYVALGVAGSLVALLAPRSAAADWVGLALLVPSAQMVGVGLVAAQHWPPAFGMGGGYVGGIEELQRLAWVVAVAGLVALVALRLATGRIRAADPGSASRRPNRWTAAGVAVLAVLPLALAAGHPDLRDLTSLGALALVYSGPVAWGICVAGRVSNRHRVAVLWSCAVAAAVGGLDASGLLQLEGWAVAPLWMTAMVLGGLALARSRPSPATAQSR